ncbi:MAG: hypothetical protein KQA35_01020 [Candidatus Aenigmarchaeota archaeon]|nr:hypothetical protein [Candidatus Aenigmarchaeota archaeon]
MKEKKYTEGMPDKKYFGQLNELNDASPYQQLEQLLDLMKRYGEGTAQMYAIAAYGNFLGLAGFDKLEEVYRSRLTPETK